MEDTAKNMLELDRLISTATISPTTARMDWEAAKPKADSLEGVLANYNKVKLGSNILSDVVELWNSYLNTRNAAKQLTIDENVVRRIGECCGFRPLSPSRDDE